MNGANRFWNVLAAIFLAFFLIFSLFGVQVARADNSPQPLPFRMDWSDTSLINTVDDWSGVPGVMGYLGQGLGNKTVGIDPQTILVDGTDTSIRVSANGSNPNTVSSAGVVEFELTDPVIGLSGSNAPHAPFLLINLNSEHNTDIHISYDVRDLESTPQDAVQQVALHYRVGSSGNFTNLPGGYVADATEPNVATKVTHVSVSLPVEAENQPLVQIRIMTANAFGRDEWVGIDNIIIDGTRPVDEPPTVVRVSPAGDAESVPVDAGLEVAFSEPVTLMDGWLTLTCSESGQHSLTRSNPDFPMFVLDSTPNFARVETCQAIILADHVVDTDGIFPANMAEDFIWNFITSDNAPLPTLSLMDWIRGSFIGRTQNFMVTMANRFDSAPIPHSRLKFTFINAHPGDVENLSVFDPISHTWIDLPLKEEGLSVTAYYGDVTGFHVPEDYTSSRMFRLTYATPGDFQLLIEWLDLTITPPRVLTACVGVNEVEAQLFLPYIQR